MNHPSEVTESPIEIQLRALRTTLGDDLVQDELGEEPGLEKQGAEHELQRLLAEQPEVLGEGMELLQREYPTAIGPVDLLCRAADGGTVAVEIKRRGGIDGVEQITRYLDLLRQDTRLHPVRGMFVAQLIAPQAKVLAMSRNIECFEVDFDRLRGIEPSDLRLF